MCFTMKVFIVALLFVCGTVMAQPSGDLITDLPGAPAYNFSMYAGYITVNSNNYFYWFVESERNPASDPLILWLNGGPGCSSLGGFLSENGPFTFDDNGNLQTNPYSWNLVANVLYLESPAGVGFSYCPTGCGTFTDNRTAYDNYQFLVSWFQEFPSYANNDFYIMGESYAGHYIPELAEIIVDNTQSNPSSPPQSNFRGFAAGNPLTDSSYDLEGPYLSTYMQTHGMLPLGDTNNEAPGNIDPYDILVDVCGSSKLKEYIRFPHPFNKMKGVTEKKRYVPNPPACVDNFMSDYLNQHPVQTAIHAKSINWEQCGGPQYTFSQQSMIPIYKKFINNGKYKVLVYSGDEDTVLNFIATEQWILDLKLPVVKAWNAWYYSRIGGTPQVGGWTITFQGLQFTTIKGAGHMVPGYQPAPALQMLKDFLS